MFQAGLAGKASEKRTDGDGKSLARVIRIQNGQWELGARVVL